MKHEQEPATADKTLVTCPKFAGAIVAKTTILGEIIGKL
jgi:hypothetical protein